MTRSKPISMKKLYKFSGDFVLSRYPKSDMDNFKSIDFKIRKGHEELSYLNDFLRFVWEHRND